MRGVRERQIEVRFPGDLVPVDAFFVGTVKGVDKVYLQSAGPASLRAVSPPRGDRTSYDRDAWTSVQRLHRALPPHGPGQGLAGEAGRLADPSARTARQLITILVHTILA